MCKVTRWIELGQAAEIGRRLRQARLARGISLKQVAGTCGGDHTRVSKIERGQFASLSPYVQRLCNHMHIDPEAPDEASPQALHARLDRLIRKKSGAAAALQAVFDALDRLTT